jgi:surfactin synthase thioesterase subunit
VPLGAPGLIAFSGTCVGRGYVNDPERTREAYLTDPHRQGARLYLGGDYGRWRPGGQLEFLGRRDAQVKVAGFRIEIGEIENTLLKVPGVRDGAVVVVERLSRSKQLVAFYSGPRALETSTLRGRLGESLPAYMLPSAFNWLEQLPLTLNGKIDRRALTALANELDVPEPQDQERLTPNEQRLAAAWSTVLGVPQNQIRRGDHFFDKGGTSLSAVKLASTMNRAVTLKDVTRVPVLSDQARLLDDRPGPRSGLLRALSEPDGTRAHTMVCFPHAGGQAVSFRPMAIALRDSGLAIYAVERPSHDVTAPGGPLASIAQVAEQVVAEIKLRGLTSILLWGHSTGAAFAVETARRLQEQGVRVEHLFLAAALLEDADAQRATITELTARPDAEIVATLSTTGDASALGQLDAPGVTAVAAAFRHDFASAHRFLAEAMDSPPSVKLSAPTTVIVAADDPSAAEFPSRHKEWLLLAEHVDLLQLPDGGHYFMLTRPYAAAEAVLAASNL